MDKILNVILRSMDNVLGFKHAMILLLDEYGEKLKVAASRGYEESGVGAEVAMGHTHQVKVKNPTITQVAAIN